MAREVLAVSAHFLGRFGHIVAVACGVAVPWHTPRLTPQCRGTLHVSLRQCSDGLRCRAVAHSTSHSVFAGIEVLAVRCSPASVPSACVMASVPATAELSASELQAVLGLSAFCLLRVRAEWPLTTFLCREPTIEDSRRALWVFDGSPC